MGTVGDRRKREPLVIVACTMARAQRVGLDRVAARERRSRSFVIRSAIDAYLARDKRRRAAGVLR